MKKQEIWFFIYIKIRAVEFQIITIKVFEMGMFQKAHLSSWERRRDGSWASFYHRVNAESYLGMYEMKILPFLLAAEYTY